MNVVVCIKQVPAKSVPMDDTNGVLDRNLSGTRLNPWDSYALEAGLQIAEATGGKVTAVTMGPESAESVLKTAFSLGVSRGILLCDPAFAGADVYATGFTLAQGICTLDGADVVICGQQTTDGDTAQLPFSLAQQLNIPAAGWVKRFQVVDNQTIEVDQELSTGTQRIELKIPCLLAIGESACCPRIPSLKNQLSARKKEIERIVLSDLPVKDPNCFGQRGSCTKVVSIHQVSRQKKTEPLVLSSEDAAQKILFTAEQVRGGEVDGN